MPTPESSSRLWNRILLATGVIVIVAGIALTFTGTGSELRVPHDVRFTVLVNDLEPEVAAQVKAGDALFTDAGGAKVGTIESVEVGPARETVPDQAGTLRAAEDPLQVEARVTIASTARVGDDIVSIAGQVVQLGQQFNIVSARYKLLGTVVSIDVR